ncbi:putative ribonuclease H protein At1g65750 family [Senna tora]|uniref:Putative ribonuclease H protein At1g65750 family n=1 Tax=Senna tora TaxID=362788 RepID=A0A834SYM7_9FABA|nr:putative ribonuclease H protein At1g65750 family [Senna tora]
MVLIMLLNFKQVLSLLFWVLMNYIIWNSRGIGSKSFPSLVRDLKRGHKVDFLVVLEPHQCGSNAVNFIRKFGFDEHDRVDASGVNIRDDRPFRFLALWVMHVNFSNMVKKAWGTVNQKDDLWTRVLRTKYRCWDDVLPQMKSSGNSSRLWKGVVRNWDHVVNGLKWRIGNGRTTRFWTDGWDWAHFEFLLPDYVCKLIAAISPPSEFHASDKVAWKHSSDGSFSVKTAYNSIVGVDNTQQDDVWHKIWRLKVP